MQLFHNSLSLAFDNIFFILFLGLIFGSFLNVVINRVPEGLSVVSPGSACPKCGYKLKWYDNIPVFSWLLLRGKCRNCGLKISIQYPLIELMVAALLIFLYLKLTFSLNFFLHGIFYFILLAISIIDLKTYSIQPVMRNFLLGSALLILGLSFFKPEILAVRWYEGIYGGVFGFTILFLLMFIGRKIYKQDAMGGGDLFILAYGGLILGVKLTLTAFIISCIVAIITYFIPWIYTAFQKRRYVNEFLSKAESYEQKTDNDKVFSELDGLKFQITNQVKSLDLPDGFDPESLNTNQDDFFSLAINYYFRCKALDRSNTAEMILKKVEDALQRKIIIFSEEVLLAVLNSAMLGYSNLKDNYQLISNEVKKLNLSLLAKELKNLEDQVKNQLKIPDLKEHQLKISALLQENKIINDKDISYLLYLNRSWQYSGYVKEQKYLADLIKKKLPFLNSQQRIRILCDLFLVYYTDFFYSHAKDTEQMLKTELKNIEIIPTIVVETYYNLALYRSVFYRTRLAFGPYLALGIFISQFWGQKLVDWYVDFFESIVLSIR